MDIIILVPVVPYPRRVTAPGEATALAGSGGGWLRRHAADGLSRLVLRPSFRWGQRQRRAATAAAPTTAARSCSDRSSRRSGELVISSEKYPCSVTTVAAASKPVTASAPAVDAVVSTSPAAATTPVDIVAVVGGIAAAARVGSASGCRLAENGGNTPDSVGGSRSC